MTAPREAAGAPVTDFSQELRRGPLREAVNYVSAGAAILAVSAGVAAWASQRQPDMPADSSPPAAAVMIDLAPEASAPAAEETQISESLNETAPSETEELETPTLDEPVETVDTPDPIEDAPVPETPEIAQPDPMAPPEDLPELDTAEAIVPPKRPELQKVEEPVKEAKPAPPKKKAPPQQVRATAQTKPSDTPRAAQSAAGAGSSATNPKWQARLMAHLERRKRYPAAARRRGDEGVATVRFSIDASGNVQSVRLLRSSGIPELDQEVVAMVQRASPVPAPPPGTKLDIAVPVRFNLR
ncbi:MAG: energy transducer TonB [Rhodovulum sulfidophilum]|uniref:Energy transducer TonB n=1 Tax=Rhodovulum sulfidophilum TaxID=35806 RepID=A0A2W5N0D9_RHOSU|nr:MAG: energy transducer TonB [Rhodovulum sulfidophilum]